MDLYLCDGKEILRQEIQTRGAAIQIPVKEGNEVSYLQVMRAETFATRKTGFSSSQTQIDIFLTLPTSMLQQNCFCRYKAAFLSLVSARRANPRGRARPRPTRCERREAGQHRVRPARFSPLPLTSGGGPAPGPARSAPPGRPLRGCHGYDRAAGPSRRRPPLGCPRQSPAERGGRPAPAGADLRTGWERRRG